MFWTGLRWRTCGKSIPPGPHRLNPGWTKLRQFCAKDSAEGRHRKAPPPWGKGGGAVYRVSVRLFLFFEGKREFQRLIFHRNAQHQLLWIFFAVEPQPAGEHI